MADGNAPDAVRQTLTSALAGDRHLGDLLWWQISDGNCDRTAFELHWATAGLSPEYLPPKITAESALRKAVRSEYAAATSRGQLIRELVCSDEYLGFAAVAERRIGPTEDPTAPPEGRLEYQQMATITLNRAFGHLLPAAPHETTDGVARAFGELLHTHTSEDLRRSIVRTLTEGFSAISLRDGGGIYWVPAPSADAVRRLQTCISHFGRSVVSLIPVHDRVNPATGRHEAIEALESVAASNLETELVALQTEIAGWETSPPARFGTMHSRIEAFETLRDRAELYRTILGVHVNDLGMALDALGEKVAAMIAAKK